MIPSYEIVILLWDWNGHVGLEYNGFEDVHRGHGFDTRNVEGKKGVGVCFCK